MIQLSPEEIFTISRQIDDPTDTTTYYVRAYVRNAKTDELLATVNLTDKGDQRFRGDWQVKADISGQGYYITITTKVFTNAGYTSESNDYRRFEQQYLVQDRFARMGGGGGGGVRVDYAKIRAMVKEEVSNIKPQETIDLSPILAQIRGVEMAISKIDMPEMSKIEFPEQKQTDFTPLLKGIKNLDEKLSLLENADLKPIIEYLHEIQKVIETKSTIEEIKKVLQILPEEFYNLIQQKRAERKPKEIVKRKEFIGFPILKKNLSSKKQFIFQ